MFQISIDLISKRIIETKWIFKNSVFLPPKSLLILLSLLLKNTHPGIQKKIYPLLDIRSEYSPSSPYKKYSLIGKPTSLIALTLIKVPLQEKRLVLVGNDAKWFLPTPLTAPTFPNNSTSIKPLKRFCYVSGLKSQSSSRVKTKSLFSLAIFIPS